MFVVFLILILSAVNGEAHYIKGYVTDGQSQGISGVLVTLSGDESDNYTTDNTGYYEFLNLVTGTYTITPTKENYYFSPSKNNYTQLNSSRESQNFLGFRLTYYIKGYITYNSGTRTEGLPGARVLLTGFRSSSNTTDSYGYYEFSGLEPGMDYFVRPEKTGYGFTPYNLSFLQIGTNQDEKNFFAVAGPVCSITGYIADSNGSIMEGVTVNLSWEVLGTVYTDNLGYYEFRNLISGWNYKVTPQKTGYVFSPERNSYPILDMDETGQNFIGLIESIETGDFKPINNMFNPTNNEKATLWYTIAEDGAVTINIYSLDGHLVKTLIDEYVFAGTHAVSWGGDNKNNETVSRGTYLVHINAPGMEKIRKIIIIK